MIRFFTDHRNAHWARLLCTALLSVFLFEILAVPYAEASLWNERRQAAPPKASHLLSHAAPASTSIPKSTAQDARRSLAQSLLGFSLPEDRGQVVEVFASTAPASESRPLVIHIQDAHGHAAAQENAAKILEELAQAASDSDGSPLLVAVEGAAGKVSGEWLAELPQEGLHGPIFRSFLVRGEITGEEYLSLSKPGLIEIEGAENGEIYRANLKARRLLEKIRPQILSGLDAVEARLETLKRKAYPERLWALDRAAGRYDLGEIVLREYLNALSSAVPLPSVKEDYRSLRAFAETARMEDSLDFEAIGRERAAVLQKLSRDLDSGSAQRLAQASLGFRLGRVPAHEFYGELLNLARAWRIAAPRLEAYLNYIEKSRAVEPEQLSSELAAYERQVFACLGGGDANLKALLDFAGRARLSRKFWDEKLSPEQWKRYQENPGAPIHPAEMEPVLRGLETAFGVASPRAGRAAASASSPEDWKFIQESYYRFAFRRDREMLDNALTLASSKKRRRLVLVAGGFHSAGIAARLRAQNISYAVIRPSLNAGETHAADNLRATAEAAEGKDRYASFVRGYLESLELLRKRSPELAKPIGQIATDWGKRISLAGPLERDGKYYLFGAYQGERSRLPFAVEYEKANAAENISVASNPDLDAALRAASGTVREPTRLGPDGGSELSRMVMEMAAAVFIALSPVGGNAHLPSANWILDDTRIARLYDGAVFRIPAEAASGMDAEVLERQLAGVFVPDAPSAVKISVERDGSGGPNGSGGAVVRVSYRADSMNRLRQARSETESAASRSISEQAVETPASKSRGRTASIRSALDPRFMLLVTSLKASWNAARKHRALLAVLFTLGTFAALRYFFSLPDVPLDSSLLAGTTLPGFINPYIDNKNINRSFKKTDQEANYRISRELDIFKEKQARSPRVLVVGAGGGRILYDMRERFPGIDLEFINRENLPAVPEMIEESLRGDKARISERVRERVREFVDFFLRKVKIHDANRPLPFGEGEFDFVIVPTAVFEYIENKMELIVEIKRILREGGTAFVIGYQGNLVFEESGKRVLHPMELNVVFNAGLENGLREFEFYRGFLVIRNLVPTRPLPLAQRVGMGVDASEDLPDMFFNRYRLIGRVAIVIMGAVSLVALFLISPELAAAQTLQPSSSGALDIDPWMLVVLVLATMGITLLSVWFFARTLIETFRAFRIRLPRGFRGETDAQFVNRVFRINDILFQRKMSVHRFAGSAVALLVSAFVIVLSSLTLVNALPRAAREVAHVESPRPPPTASGGIVIEQPISTQIRDQNPGGRELSPFSAEVKRRYFIANAFLESFSGNKDEVKAITAVLDRRMKSQGRPAPDVLNDPLERFDGFIPRSGEDPFAWQVRRWAKEGDMGDFSWARLENDPRVMPPGRARMVREAVDEYLADGSGEVLDPVTLAGATAYKTPGAPGNQGIFLVRVGDHEFYIDFRRYFSIEIPSELRPLANGQPRLFFKGSTLQETLIQMEERFPDLQAQLLDEKKQLRPGVRVFVEANTLDRGDTIPEQEYDNSRLQEKWDVRLARRIRIVLAPEFVTVSLSPAVLVLSEDTGLLTFSDVMDLLFRATLYVFFRRLLFGEWPFNRQVSKRKAAPPAKNPGRRSSAPQSIAFLTLAGEEIDWSRHAKRDIVTALQSRGPWLLNQWWDGRIAIELRRGGRSWLLLSPFERNDLTLQPGDRLRVVAGRELAEIRSAESERAARRREPAELRQRRISAPVPVLNESGIGSAGLNDDRVGMEIGRVLDAALRAKVESGTLFAEINGELVMAEPALAHRISLGDSIRFITPTWVHRVDAALAEAAQTEKIRNDLPLPQDFASWIRYLGQRKRTTALQAIRLLAASENDAIGSPRNMLFRSYVSAIEEILPLHGALLNAEIPMTGFEGFEAELLNRAFQLRMNLEITVPSLGEGEESNIANVAQLEEKVQAFIALRDIYRQTVENLNNSSWNGMAALLSQWFKERFGERSWQYRGYVGLAAPGWETAVFHWVGGNLIRSGYLAGDPYLIGFGIFWGIFLFTALHFTGKIWMWLKLSKQRKWNFAQAWRETFFHRDWIAVRKLLIFSVVWTLPFLSKNSEYAFLLSWALHAAHNVVILWARNSGPYETYRGMTNDLPQKILKLLRKQTDLSRVSRNGAADLMELVGGLYRQFGMFARSYHSHAHNLGVPYVGLLFALGNPQTRSSRDFKVAFLGEFLHDFHLRETGTYAKVDETLRQLSAFTGLRFGPDRGAPREAKFAELATGYVQHHFLSAFQAVADGDPVQEIANEVTAVIRRTDFPSDVDAPLVPEDKLILISNTRAQVDGWVESGMALSSDSLRRKIRSLERAHRRYQDVNPARTLAVKRVLAIERNYLAALLEVSLARRAAVHRIAVQAEKSDLSSYALLATPEFYGQITDDLEREGVKARRSGNYAFFFDRFLVTEQVFELIRAVPSALRRNYFNVMGHFYDYGFRLIFGRTEPGFLEALQWRYIELIAAGRDWPSIVADPDAFHRMGLKDLGWFEWLREKIAEEPVAALGENPTPVSRRFETTVFKEKYNGISAEWEWVYQLPVAVLGFYGLDTFLALYMMVFFGVSSFVYVLTLTESLPLRQRVREILRQIRLYNLLTFAVFFTLPFVVSMGISPILFTVLAYGTLFAFGRKGRSAPEKAVAFLTHSVVAVAMLVPAILITHYIELPAGSYLEDNEELSGENAGRHSYLRSMALALGVIFAIHARKYWDRLLDRLFPPSEAQKTRDAAMSRSGAPPIRRVYPAAKVLRGRLPSAVRSLSLAARTRRPVPRLPGMVVGLVAPSGVGANTLIGMLERDYPGLVLRVVRHTTRQPREEEQHGRDYFFVSRKSFGSLEARNSFVRVSEFLDEKRGVDRKRLLKSLAQGKILILNMTREDPALKELLGSRYLTVKISPIAREQLGDRALVRSELESRLRWRGMADEEEIQKRLEAGIKIVGDIDPERDHVVYNLPGEQEQAKRDFERILFNSTFSDELALAGRPWRTLSGENPPKVVVIYGSARIPPGHPAHERLKRLAYRLAKAGYIVRTGGGPGMMKAASDGAFEGGGIVQSAQVAISQEEQKSSVTEAKWFDHIPIRKAVLSNGVEAALIFEGGFGTADEWIEVQRQGIPVITAAPELWEEPWNSFEQNLKDYGYWDENLYASPYIAYSDDEIFERLNEISLTPNRFARQRIAMTPESTERMRREEIQADQRMESMERAILFLAPSQPNSRALPESRRVISQARGHLRNLASRLMKRGVSLRAEGLTSLRLIRESGADRPDQVQGVLLNTPYERDPDHSILENPNVIVVSDGPVQRHALEQNLAAVVAGPGNLGKINILFSVLVQIQTGKREKIPMIFVGRKFWEPILSEFVEKMKAHSPPLISEDHDRLYRIVNTENQAMMILEQEGVLSELSQGSQDASAGPVLGASAPALWLFGWIKNSETRAALAGAAESAFIVWGIPLLVQLLKSVTPIDLTPYLWALQIGIFPLLHAFGPLRVWEKDEDGRWDQKDYQSRAPPGLPRLAERIALLSYIGLLGYFFHIVFNPFVGLAAHSVLYNLVITRLPFFRGWLPLAAIIFPAGAHQPRSVSRRRQSPVREALRSARKMSQMSARRALEDLDERARGFDWHESETSSAMMSQQGSGVRAFITAFHRVRSAGEVGEAILEFHSTNNGGHLIPYMEKHLLHDIPEMEGVRAGMARLRRMAHEAKTPRAKARINTVALRTFDRVVSILEEKASSPTLIRSRSRALPGLMAAVNMMDLGVEVHRGAGRPWLRYRASFAKLRTRIIPYLASRGVSSLYLYGGVYTPSKLSSLVHTVPDDGLHLRRSGNAWVLVGNYDVKRVEYPNGIKLDDRFGNSFSSDPSMPINPAMSSPGIRPEQDFADMASAAHQRGMQVITDFVAWPSPDGITEENYRWFIYRELDPRQNDRFRRVLGAERDAFVQSILEQNRDWAAVRIPRENGAERLILVKLMKGAVPHLDQVFPNIFMKEVQDHYIERIQRNIRLGVDGVRVDLAGRLLNENFRYLVSGVEHLMTEESARAMWDGEEPLLRIMRAARAYAWEKRRIEFKFTCEAYDDDRRKLVALGFDDSYNNDILKAYWDGDHFARVNPGLIRWQFLQAWWNSPRLRSYLSNFDEQSLLNILEKPDLPFALMLPLLGLAAAGVPVMIDLREFMAHSGHAVTIAGGKNPAEHMRGSVHQITHPFATLEQLMRRVDIDGYMRELRASWPTALLERIYRSVMSLGEGLFEIEENGNPQTSSFSIIATRSSRPSLLGASNFSSEPQTVDLSGPLNRLDPGARYRLTGARLAEDPPGSGLYRVTDEVSGPLTLGDLSGRIAALSLVPWDSRFFRIEPLAPPKYLFMLRPALRFGSEDFPVFDHVLRAVDLQGNELGFLEFKSDEEEVLDINRVQVTDPGLSQRGIARALMVEVLRSHPFSRRVRMNGPFSSDEESWIERLSRDGILANPVESLSAERRARVIELDIVRASKSLEVPQDTPAASGHGIETGHLVSLILPAFISLALAAAGIVSLPGVQDPLTLSLFLENSREFLSLSAPLQQLALEGLPSVGPWSQAGLSATSVFGAGLMIPFNVNSGFHGALAVSVMKGAPQREIALESLDQTVGARRRIRSLLSAHSPKKNNSIFRFLIHPRSFIAASWHFLIEAARTVLRQVPSGVSIKNRDNLDRFEKVANELEAAFSSQGQGSEISLRAALARQPGATVVLTVFDLARISPADLRWILDRKADGKRQIVVVTNPAVMPVENVTEALGRNKFEADQVFRVEEQPISDRGQFDWLAVRENLNLRGNVIVLNGYDRWIRLENVLELVWKPATDAVADWISRVYGLTAEEREKLSAEPFKNVLSESLAAAFETELVVERSQ